MKFDIEVIKKHPYLVGGSILIIGGIVFYLIVRKSGSSAAPASDGSAESVQLLQAQTAQQVSAQQYGAQLQMATIAGQVQAYQVQGQVAIANAKYMTEAAIQSKHDDTQVALATIGAAQYGDYLDTQKIIELGQQQTDLAIAQSRDTAAVDITGIQASTYFGIAQLQQELAKYGIDAQRASESDRLDYMRDLADAVLRNPEFGRKYGGSSTGVTQILAALQGQGPAALASTNPAAYGGGFSIDIPGIGSIGAQL